MGRADYQIKIRGFRVEPGEIEAALVRHESVREALVIAHRRDERDTLLFAYLVRQAGLVDPPDPVRMRRFLQTSLPDYMVPSAYVWVDAWPLTPNRKIDRAALRRLTPSDLGTGVAGAHGHTPPRTNTESVLVSIWQVALGLDRIGIEDNFFDLGGHSLLASRVLSRIRGELGHDAPLRILFQKPTIQEFAAWLDAQTRSNHAGSGPVPLERVERLPLSPAQRRMWFLQRIEPENPAYGIALPYRVVGPLNPEPLERAWRFVCERHESLRANFFEDHGEPYAKLDAAPPQPIRYFESESEEHAIELLRAHARQPFDLAREPLVRFYVYSLGDDINLILIHMHHIISDGWSVGVFFEDLNRCYQAFSRDEQPDLPSLPIQYPDYAAWHAEWLNGEWMTRSLAYWKEALAGAPHVLELPTDFPRPSNPSYLGDVRRIEVPAELAQRLRALASQEQATPFMLFLAAFQTLILRYSGGDDFLLGSPAANRTRAELEGLIGFFVNTLVLRAPIGKIGGGRSSFRELLRAVREVVFRAFEHQDLIFDKLVEELRPERDLSRNPLIQVAFNYQSAVARKGKIGGTCHGAHQRAWRGLSLRFNPDHPAGRRRF